MPVNYKKVENLINSIVTMDNINWYDILSLNQEISDKLYTFQVYCVYELLIAMQTNDIILNGSDTGTGKTYVTAALCREAIIKGVKKPLKPIVFCKKSMVTYWNNVLNEFNVEPVAIINYEVVTGNRISEDFKYKNILSIDHMDSTPSRFKWKMQNDYCIVFDEVHECKNPKSLHGKLLLSTKDIGNKIIMLSATASSMPKDFAIFAFMLGFSKTIRQGKSWVLGKQKADERSLVRVCNSSINKAIYPDKGSRMDINELDDSFPKNNIAAIGYDLDVELVDIFNAKYTFARYGKNNPETNDETEKKANTNVIGEITHVRMELEILKVNILTELAKEYLSYGFNVVLFVSFNKTIDLLAKSLKTNNILNGETNIKTRETIMEQFQTSQINLVICNIAIGSTSINLNNKLGKPAISLISTQISGIMLKQTLGRIYRVGTTGYVLQRIIYFANTIESNLWNGVKEKIKFIDSMNGKELEEFNDTKIIQA